MWIKKILQKIYKKLFVSKNTYRVKFQVLNLSDDIIWSKYHDIAWFCDDAIMHTDKEFNGVWAIYGNNKKNIATVIYDKRNTDVIEIQKYLEKYGLRIKQIKNVPLKKLFFKFIEM